VGAAAQLPARARRRSPPVAVTSASAAAAARPCQLEPRSDLTLVASIVLIFDCSSSTFSISSATISPSRVDVVVKRWAAP
jgi:hypothetical protein